MKKRIRNFIVGSITASFLLGLIICVPSAASAQTWTYNPLTSWMANRYHRRYAVRRTARRGRRARARRRY